MDSLNNVCTSDPHITTWNLEETTNTSSSKVEFNLPQQKYSRPLGLLESNFNRSAINNGQSDIFFSLNIETDSPIADSLLWKRLSFSWAKLRNLHPLLGAVMVSPDATDSSPLDAPSDVVVITKFLYTVPQSDEECLSESRKTLLVEEVEGVDSVHSTMEKWIGGSILNGKRVYLDQKLCLARLLVVRSISGRSHSIALVISHVISDGVSVITILNDLFEILASPSFPTPSSTPLYSSHHDFILGLGIHKLYTSQDELAVLAHWQLLELSNSNLLLPLSSEDLYPTLPLGSTLLSNSKLKIRRRWIWAISRVLSNLQHSKYPQSLRFPRLVEELSPKLPVTTWPILRFSKEDSNSIIILSMKNALSPRMAISDQFSPVKLNSNLVIGFPFSFRPFLTSHRSPAVDLALRISFSAIHLPVTQSLSLNQEKVEEILLKNARLAKLQLDRKLSKDSIARTHLLASSHLSNLNRKRTFEGLESWFNEPKSALNASMIGDLDRILPTLHQLPSPDSTCASLKLSDLKIGTRLHSGEGALAEIWTWDGQINVSIGYDSGIFDSEQISKLLSSIDKIGKIVAEVGKT